LMNQMLKPQRTRRYTKQEGKRTAHAESGV
jgi:hypothetical protein